MSIRTGSLCVMALAACQAGANRPGPEPVAAVGSFTKPVSFAILEDYDKGADLAQVVQDFALFRQLGVPVWRGSFGWDDYEPTRGGFDFAWLDRFVALADSMGISLRPYLGYTPQWAASGGTDEHAWNDPPRSPDDWVRFAGVIAARLRNHRSILSYEIYNEENVRLWWDGTATQYADVLHRGSRALRRADPDVQVLLGGMVWPDVDWLEAACANGESAFDVIPFHAYPETWTPDSIRVENYLGSGYRDDFLPEADELCGPKPIWINETGFATSPGKSEAEQAQWWARAFATFISAPRVEHLGIYEIRDQRQGTPVIGDAPNYYLGLLRTDGTRKPAFETVKLLVRLFGRDSITVADRDLKVRVTEGKPGRLYHHLFIRPDRQQLVFVWDLEGSPTVDLQLPRAAGRVTAYDAAAREQAWSEVSGSAIRGVKLEPERVRIFLAAGE